MLVGEQGAVGGAEIGQAGAAERRKGEGGKSGQRGGREEGREGGRVGEEVKGGGECGDIAAEQMV